MQQTFCPGSFFITLPPPSLSLYISIYIYICMYVCMYVCNVCMYVCMHACMHACMYVCMYVYMYLHMHTHRHRSIDRSLTSFVDHPPFRLSPNISKPSNFPCAIQILLDYTVIPSYTLVLVVNDFFPGIFVDLFLRSAF